MDLELDGRGFRRYLRSVAEELGLADTGQFVHLEHPVHVYLPLDARLTTVPDQDVALVWDERRGWAVGVETEARDPVVPVSYFGDDVLPPPEAVARFVREVLDGTRPTAIVREERERAHQL